MVEEKIQKMMQLYSWLISSYQEMHSTAESQNKLIETIDFTVEEDLARLNHFLMSRQELMKQIDDIQQEINTIKKHVTDKLRLPEFNYNIIADFCSAREAAEFEKVLAELKELLKKISELDAGSQEILQLKLNQVKEQIRNIQRGKRANSSYNPVIKQSEGFFIDKK